MCWLTHCPGLPQIGSDDPRFGSVYLFVGSSHGCVAPYALSGRGKKTAACFLVEKQRSRAQARPPTTTPRSRSFQLEVKVGM